jgi:hypothetical protein
VAITTDVVNSNLDQGEVYNIVIKFFSDLQQVGGFLPSPLVSSTKKTDHNNITKIMLKVALNTIKEKNNK